MGTRQRQSRLPGNRLTGLSEAVFNGSSDIHQESRKRVQNGYPVCTG
jgi:hypothetical protein